MKSLTNQKFRPLLFFLKNKNLRSSLSLLITVSFLNLILSCKYYNVKDVTTTSDNITEQIDEFIETQKYFIIHSGKDTYILRNLKVNEDEKTISGIVERFDKEYVSKKPREEKRTHRYNNKDVLNEVHFYLKPKNNLNYGDQTIISFSEINSISVNDKNTGKTVINVVGTVIGVLAITAIIAALLKSSCPFIYVQDGEEFVFTGELYPGVLTPNQQFDDYLLLPTLNEVNSEYNIKITNELKEIQYTDFVQLLRIDHPDNLKVLLDKNGDPQTFSKIIPPSSVSVDNLNIDNNPTLIKDNNSYLFNSELNNSSSTRNIELEFNKPSNVETAKLYLTVKNSMWLDYVFGKFNQQFGTYYSKFQKDQQSVSSEESTKWIQEQNIPLSVYLKTNNGWDLVERINTVGPMAFRDIAIPIDLRKVFGKNIRIKLETGFMFWEVDYVGIDYSENKKLDIKYINPYKAIDGNGKNVTNLLITKDQKYLVQPYIGDNVLVTFKMSESNHDLKSTYYLKNRGYYNYIRNYKGEANFQKLKLFRKDGAFTDFSKYEYEALMDYDGQLDLVSISKD